MGSCHLLTTIVCGSRIGVDKHFFFFLATCLATFVLDVSTFYDSPQTSDLLVNP